MQALLVVDAQNEFSAKGLRPVPNYSQAIERILFHVQEARANRMPIAWIRHHNKPHESRAFVPGTWGAKFAPGLGLESGHGAERVFEKDVFGAFTGTALDEWLRSLRVTRLLLVGFYTHMCLSTSAREALVRGFEVAVDPDATGARDLEDAILGKQTADEVRRSALLQLQNMGVTVALTATAAQRVLGPAAAIPDAKSSAAGGSE